MSGIDSDRSAPKHPGTRLIHLDGGQRRDPGANCRTMIGGPVVPLHGVPFEALFVAHYRAIRALGRSIGDPGVAIVAVHVPSCQLVARAWVGARPGRVQSALVGRHSEVDVMLEDPMLSLRHLVLLLPPPTSWHADGVAYEVLDLRTAQAFRDERGRPLEGLRAEGPALVAVGAHALFLLPTGDPSDWPELATDAWSMLPERVFTHEQEAEPDRWRRGRYGPRRAAPSESRSRTMVTSISSVLAPGERLVAEGEDTCGSLRVTGAHGSRRIPVGAQALGRGILLGRYDRCDASELLDDDRISRTHLLVKRVDGSIVGVDTASTHGTYVEGDPHRARAIALGEGQVADMAGEVASIAWEPA